LAASCSLWQSWTTEGDLCAFARLPWNFNDDAKFRHRRDVTFPVGRHQDSEVAKRNIGPAISRRCGFTFLRRRRRNTSLSPKYFQTASVCAQKGLQSFHNYMDDLLIGNSDRPERKYESDGISIYIATRPRHSVPS
jgi:hypothetical protein